MTLIHYIYFEPYNSFIDLMEKAKFKKLFPSLAKELDNEEAVVKINQATPGGDRKWAGHDPDAIDFIRRCSTEKEALEIISYLENKGELTVENAADLREQLKNEGLESFGSHKDKDFYHKNR